MRSLKGFDELANWLSISKWNFDFEDNFIQEVDPITDLYGGLESTTRLDRNIIYLKNNNLSEYAKKTCFDINAENEDSYTNPPMPVPKKIEIPLMMSEGLFYIGGSIALTKYVTDRLLSSTQKVIPSLSKYFNTKKVRWGLPIGLLLIGVPLFKKLNKNLYISIYNNTIRRMSRVFENQVLNRLAKKYHDKPFFKLYFLYHY